MMCPRSCISALIIIFIILHIEISFIEENPGIWWHKLENAQSMISRHINIKTFEKINHQFEI